MPPPPRPPERDAQTRRQVAVLPLRGTRKKGYRVLLITSRETRRWVIPKGWPMKGLKPHEAARQEAYEEAGLVGPVGKRPLGYYLYDKRLKNGAAVPCLVQVFPMSVRKRLERFPEVAERDAHWFPLSEAADLVTEPGLAAIIRAVGNQDGRHKKGPTKAIALPPARGDEPRPPEP
jgi:8-oxo-dGTP pyrophosphatase MutT (NUDIX family)